MVNLLQEAARLRREEDEAREPSAREPPTGRSLRLKSLQLESSNKSPRIKTRWGRTKRLLPAKW